MKRLFAFFLVFAMLTLSSCMASHYHMGPAPTDKERWVCDEVDMWFFGSGYGEITVDGEVIPVDVYVDDIEFVVLILDPPVLGKDDMIMYGDPIYPKSDLYLAFHEYAYDYFTIVLEKNYDHSRYHGILDDDEEITTLTFRKVIVEDGSTAE